MKRKNAFTLIELVIVVAIMAIIMVAITNVIVSLFRARTRAEIGDKLEQNGNAILAEIRNNFYNSDGTNVSCLPVGMAGIGDSIIFNNRWDGVATTIQCFEGAKIASKSASMVDPYYLTSDEVVVSDCDTFVTCDALPSLPSTVMTANFKFTLTTVAGGGGGGVGQLSRKFETKLVVRD